MLASLAEAPLDDPDRVYEPKYDGIRAIADVELGRIHLWSRNGNVKAKQFPEVVRDLLAFRRRPLCECSGASSPPRLRHPPPP